MMEIQRRYIAIAPTLEVREEQSLPGGIFRGLASSVNQEYTLYEDSQNVFAEVIAPGAFRNANADDIRVLLNHDPNLILGRTAAGTAKVEERPDGLYYEWQNDANISYARDLAISIERGDITQSSFAFTIKSYEDKYTKMEDGREKVLRTILEMEKIYDVSPVTYPANQKTTVSARNFEEAFKRAQEELNEKTYNNKTIIHLGLRLQRKRATI
jgi:HK97 family phage prohead protease